MDASIQEKLFVKEGLTMNDCTFFNALKQCFVKKQNCVNCPLYAYGMRENDQCIKTLAIEIDERKFTAYAKDEKGD